jgi:hypothetical protein
MNRKKQILREEIKELYQRIDNATELNRIGGDEDAYTSFREEVDVLMIAVREKIRELNELDVEEEKEANAWRRERLKSDEGQAAFWFQRFFTTLGVANAAAFAALASALLKFDDMPRVAPMVLQPLTSFGAGLLWAGLIPFFLWLRYAANVWLDDRFDQPRITMAARQLLKGVGQTATITAAVFSVYFFWQGLFDAIGKVHGIVDAVAK